MTQNHGELDHWFKILTGWNGNFEPMVLLLFQMLTFRWINGRVAGRNNDKEGLHMDYKRLAEQILELVGGKENVSGVLYIARPGFVST